MTPGLLAPIMRLFPPLERLLGRRHPAPTEAPEVEDLTRLDRILLLFARRRGTQDWFRLMTDQMSPDCIMYKTTEPLKIDENLMIQLLLNRGRSVMVPGKVNWVMATETGMAGQLDLTVPDPNREQVREFLREMRARD